MSIRTKVLGLVDVIMRVPPLFIIDEILKLSMGLPVTTIESHTSSSSDIINTIISASNDSNSSSTSTSTVNNFANLTDDLERDLDFLKVISLSTLKFAICLIGK